VLHSRRGEQDEAVKALAAAHALLSDDVDPLAVLHLNLTECRIAAQQENIAAAQQALTAARKIADIKWDPYGAARTLVYGLLFARERLDNKVRSRLLRQLSVYPDLLWRFHWATARQLTAEGAIRKALDEYGRGVAVLKSVSARLPETSRDPFLNSPAISQFKVEAMRARNSLSRNG
jgi:hypothetical protein